MFPELDKEEWKSAKESAVAHGQHGLVHALNLTTQGISNARSQISTHIGFLNGQIEKLNLNLHSFNESSGDLTKKALNLTKWIMVATVASSVATVLLAIQVLVDWIK